MARAGPTTLHENSMTKLSTTPDGKIFDSELTNIFSIMIICLNLKERETQRGTFSFTKTYPYSFQVANALSVLKVLKFTVEQSKTVTSMEYSINPELGFALLKKFYSGHFLHAPADRTRSEPNHSVALQPTPKGTCILQNFAERVGMDVKNYPPILFSNFNSMYLLKFDRDPTSDKILYSKYLINFIFITMMGDSPRVWSPSAKAESIPPIKRKLKLGMWQDGESSDEDSNLNSISSTNSNIYITNLKNHYKISDSNQEIGLPDFRNASTSSIPTTTIIDSESVAKFPFHHKYFTNPESDSHVQYYISSSGVRVFENKQYYFEKGGGHVNIPYSFTGKAILQWLCDCTEIYNPNQGIGIANLLLKLQLVEPIISKGSKSNCDSFVPARNAYYKLSKLGETICHWNKPEDDKRRPKEYEINSEFNGIGTGNLGDSQASKVSVNLATTLKDPGLRLLFKEHLESEFCVENLQVYQLLKEFHSQVKTCRIIYLKSKESDNSSILSMLNKKLNDLETMACQVYVNFLAEDAPHVINIDFELRKQAIEVMDKIEDTEDDETAIERRFHTLEKKSKVFFGVSKSIYALLEDDSLPKFLESKIFNDAMATLDALSI
ncbi:protein Sst2p [[Candida] railenensis]|uniref:Protein Sst2p n=1 Tax=[Candida] railenensis TaxID=45579 RepID=A0A9P0QQ24_9ASCO|nr:protein Sst2p [[Candida] railenensis]